MADMPFDRVLDAARTGAGWAFRCLFDELAPPVAGYLRSQGAAEADDLTSEVFERTFRAVASFSGSQQQFRSWVFTIAHNRLVDERRRRARRPSLEPGLPEEAGAQMRGGDVEEEAMRRMATERVRRLCETMAPDQRDVLLLRMVGCLTVEEVAEALGKTSGAVKALQRRALATLRRRMEREGVPL